MNNMKSNNISIKSKQQIKNTFIAMVIKEPNKRVKVVELCKQAQLNRSTFYTNYYDIDQVAEDIQAEMVASLQQIFKIEISSTDYLQLLFSAFFELIRDNQAFYFYYFITINSPNELNILDNSFVQNLLSKIQLELNNQNDYLYDLAFFNGGVASLIRMWLNEDCCTPIPTLVNLIISKIENSYF